MIELDTAEQEKIDEELKQRFQKYFDCFEFENDKNDWHFLFKLSWTLISASPEDFQLLKHAAKDIADKYKL